MIGSSAQRPNDAQSPLPKKALTVHDVLGYEINASWWSGLISFDWGQNLAGRYFAWKVTRKWNRYATNLNRKAHLANLGSGVNA